MPSFCIIDTCKQVKQIGENYVSFHKFPFKNSELLQQWIDFVVKVDSPKDRSSKRQKKITKFSTICCQHFTQDDFTTNSLRRRCLKKTAIPTVDFIVKRNDSSRHHDQNSSQKNTDALIEIIEAEYDTPILEIVEEEVDTLNQNFCSLCKAASKLNVIDDICFGLIKKCLPLITLHDSLDHVCTKCVSTLRTFSSFIDKVISTQGNSMTINLPEPGETANFEFTRNIKTEPITNYECQQEDQHQKLPFIQIVDFNAPSKFSSNINQLQTHHQTTSQNKCKILEIVDIKPFLYGNQNHGLIQIPSEDFVDDDDIQIVSPSQMKVELPDLNCEVDSIKKLPLEAAMNDHNYHRYNENDIKVEFDEDFQENQSLDVLKICRLCKKNFSSIRRYLMHKALHHPPSKIFKTKKIKVKNHDNIRRMCRMAIEKMKITKVVQICLKKSKKSYVCETCGKTFKGSKNLYQHRLSHSEVSKYICKICDKTFKRAHGLRQHVKSIHENEKSHQCPVCDHRYLLKSDMNKCRHRNLRRINRSRS